MLLSVHLFQLLNMGYFMIYNDWFYKAGLIFIIIQSLVMVALYYQYSIKRKQTKEMLVHIECQEEEEVSPRVLGREQREESLSVKKSALV